MQMCSCHVALLALGRLFLVMLKCFKSQVFLKCRYATSHFEKRSSSSRRAAASEWKEGTELRIERSRSRANGRAGRSSDEWMDKVEALAAKIHAGEDDHLAAAIRQVREEAKELARKGKR
jgi:hypothetical protein